MLSIQYDSSFDGFLSVVFEVYRQRLVVGDIIPDRVEGVATDLFMQPFRIETSMESARRLKRAIVNSASEEVLNLLEMAFRSEEAGVEMKILAYLRKLFSGINPHYGKNPTSEEMLPLYTIARSVSLELGDMRGMVRFNRLEDGTYFAEIEPKYDIVNLLTSHFRARFANERWAIYDSKRKYGIHYDGREVNTITIPDLQSLKNSIPPDTMMELWKDYYKAVSIQERENPKLLKRCLPVRYWKHLPEREAYATPWIDRSGGRSPGLFSDRHLSLVKNYSGGILLPSEAAKANSQRVLTAQKSIR